MPLLSSSDKELAKSRELPAVTHDLHLDLKLSSDQDLQAAIHKLQVERKTRSLISHSKLTIHFNHIEHELKDTVEACQLSIEHLELYRNYMVRYQPLTLPSQFETRRMVLLNEIKLKLLNHPLSKAAKSGDMASAVAVARRNSTTKSPRRTDTKTTLGVVMKTPLRRRRQMMAMLGLNFFTGPMAVMLCSILFLYFGRPYSYYVSIAYFSYIFVDNKFRALPRPATKFWSHSGIFRLFRNYFPIR